ncbi:DUF1648 domain-containing protein [Streptomyces nitrosporeus]|uniref:DUF1648 domain-containing protein n=1 Tax=Streptomyces nitrosporeus TaxID=28894 RepID=UPI0039A04583
MNHRKLMYAALGALPFVLVVLTDLALVGAVGDRLPDRVASHFSFSGKADGHTGRTVFLLVTVALPVLLGAVWSFLAARDTFRGGRAYDGFLVSGYAVAGFTGYLTAATLLANVDTADGGPAAALSPWQMAAAAGTAVAAAALGLLANRLLPAPPDGPEGHEGAGRGARIALAEGEVAGWVRGTTSWWPALSAVALAAGGVAVTVEAGPAAGLPLVVVGAFLVTFSRPNVTVDRRGLTVSGLLPWPRVRIPLERVEGATSREVKALGEYGGWGYRIRPGGSGVILRSGEAIVARLKGGREFTVTIDDSATGAALLNTLAGRDRGES